MIDQLNLPTTVRRSAPRPATYRGSLAVIVFLLVAALLLERPTFSGAEVCTLCGLRRDHFDLHARIFDLPLHRFHRESATAVSRVFADTALPAAAHVHRWADGAAPVGEADALSQTSSLAELVDAPRVAAFLRALAASTPAATQEKWRALIFDPVFSQVAARSLRFLRFPETGFADPLAFRAWWGENEFALWNRLRELTEAD